MVAPKSKESGIERNVYCKNRFVYFLYYYESLLQDELVCQSNCADFFIRTTNFQSRLNVLNVILNEHREYIVKLDVLNLFTSCN